MGYEIDFLPVGNSKSGDAIALRFGNLYGQRHEQTVVLIDGGFQDSGRVVVNHLREHYKTSQIDLVVSTHPDEDHIGGLDYVLSECQVGHLWMHRPWNHTDDIAKMFVNGRVTDKSVSEALRKSLDQARSLERAVLAKKIPITEPFAGVTDATGQVVVLGPTQPYYESLLPEFRCTPEAKTQPGIVEKALSGAREFIQKVAEHWDIETLDATGETSAENNSSTILLVELGDDCLLFTADAGTPALTQATGLLARSGFDFNRLKFVQVPHHGSVRNVGPTLLDALLGPKLKQEAKRRSAFVSVANLDDPKHPSKRVLNAFRRRGAPVCATAGGTKNNFANAPGWPARPGWVAVQPLPFYFEVED